MAKNTHDSVYFNRELNTFSGIDSQIHKQLQDTYIGVDIDRELKKMALWLCSEKGRRRKGNIGFILNWLNNASPIPPTTSEQLDLIESKTPLGRLIYDYLLELWKDKEHIFEFNTIRAKR